MDLNKPIRLKIISMGDAEVGKSCIIKRYCEKRFVAKYLATIGIDYGVTRVNQKSTELKVNIFDMAGHPIFYEDVKHHHHLAYDTVIGGGVLCTRNRILTIRPAFEWLVRNEFYRDTQGVLLVYDAGNKKSFENLEKWLDEMKNELSHPRDMDNIVICVCSNKSDKRKVVDPADGRMWADSQGFLFFETSAFNGEGVQEMFQSLFESVVTAARNGGKRAPITTQLGYTKEQVDTIQRLKQGKTDYERMGLYQGANKEEINRVYRKLAVLLHPDKSVAPGTEEAFKLLVAARTSLLKNASNS